MNAPITDELASLASIRPLVRIVIVGHVDHGKSTLIGRLLYETDSLPDGKMEALEAVSARRGMAFEWSFLLDALQTERDQGITLDTSQIHFRTPSRDVVLIDAPGHAEFLRNMITGASEADAAVLIVDAAEGVREQTRRHGYLLHLLGVRQVAVVINKMDRVGFDPERFTALASEIGAHLAGIGVIPTAVIPASARNGDGIAARTPALAWYGGPTVIEALDRFSPARPVGELPLRLPVQAVYRGEDRRIIAGRVETGRIAVGDEIVVVPSGQTARVVGLETWPVRAGVDAPRAAGAGRSVGFTIDRDLFVDRGHVIASAAVRPSAVRRLRARVFWLHQTPLALGTTLVARIATAQARATISAIHEVVDPGHLSAIGTGSIGRNQIGEIDITLAQPLAADTYAINPRTGRLVLELGGRIAGGGIVLSIDLGEDRKRDIVAVSSAVSAPERTRRHGHAGAVVWLTGLPGAGKSTLARALERRLFARGGAPLLLDGDTLRGGLNADLGFAPAERAENVRRIAEVAAHLARNGLIAIVAAVSPARGGRAEARRIAGDAFHEVHVATAASVCEARDPKGHYRKARAGGLMDFTGVGADYEPPERAELTIDAGASAVEAAAEEIERLLEGAVLASRSASPDFTI